MSLPSPCPVQHHLAQCGQQSFHRLIGEPHSYPGISGFSLVNTGSMTSDDSKLHWEGGSSLRVISRSLASSHPGASLIRLQPTLPLLHQPRENSLNFIRHAAGQNKEHKTGKTPVTGTHPLCLLPGSLGLPFMPPFSSPRPLGEQHL